MTTLVPTTTKKTTQTITMINQTDEMLSQRRQGSSPVFSVSFPSATGPLILPGDNHRIICPSPTWHDSDDDNFGGNNDKEDYTDDTMINQTDKMLSQR